MPRILVGLVLAFVLSPAARADFRVVVQEAHPARYKSLQISPDGKLAWAVTGVNEHILQVIDPERGLVLRRFYLPDRIASAWVDTKSRALAVSTQSAVLLGNLIDEDLVEVLPGVSGAVRLDDGAALLAVLGRIPDPKKKERSRLDYHPVRELGLFELKEKRWRFVRPTPIVAPGLHRPERRPVHDGPAALLFE